MNDEPDPTTITAASYLEQLFAGEYAEGTSAARDAEQDELMKAALDWSRQQQLLDPTALTHLDFVTGQPCTAAQAWASSFIAEDLFYR